MCIWCKRGLRYWSPSIYATDLYNERYSLSRKTRIHHDAANEERRRSSRNTRTINRLPNCHSSIPSSQEKRIYDNSCDTVTPTTTSTDQKQNHQKVWSHQQQRIWEISFSPNPKPCSSMRNRSTRRSQNTNRILKTPKRFSQKKIPP